MAFPIRNCTANSPILPREDLIAMAKALDIELVEADFAQKSELDEDELVPVAGGQSCYCAVSDPTQGYGLYVDWMLGESEQV